LQKDFKFLNLFKKVRQFTETLQNLYFFSVSSLVFFAIA